VWYAPAAGENDGGWGCGIGREGGPPGANIVGALLGAAGTAGPGYGAGPAVGRFAAACIGVIGDGIVGIAAGGGAGAGPGGR
jgi:hypothetical protein